MREYTRWLCCPTSSTSLPHGPRSHVILGLLTWLPARPIVVPMFRHGRKGQPMKVTHATTRILRTPADNPLVVGLPMGNDTREFITLELGTDEGIEGIGLTFF